MGEPVLARDSREEISRWPQRYTVVALFFLGTALCYIDRISISVAIIPLARPVWLRLREAGVVLSAIFWGYIWTQLAGGWMADRFGGHRVLARGRRGLVARDLHHARRQRPRVSRHCSRRGCCSALAKEVNFPSIHSLTARWTCRPSVRACSR